jgi:hypothetical protein
LLVICVHVHFFFTQNSWGSNWGEKGYVKVRRGTNEIGIEQEVVAGSVVVPTF